MTKRKEQSLTVHALSVRDEIVRRIHALTKTVVTGASGNETMRAQGYNEGLKDAVQIVTELL